VVDVLTAPEEDAFSPLYQAVRATRDTRQWQTTLADARRAVPVQTPADLRALIQRIAAEEGADPLLMEAMVGPESGGDPRAVSPKGAQGLLQLMPATAARFSVTNPFDPEDNLRGGAKYLAFLKGEFPGRIDLQIAAYNAGEGAVKKYGNAIPPYDETQKHVPAVLARYAALGGTSYVSKSAGTGAPGTSQAPRAPVDPQAVDAAFAAALPAENSPAFAAVQDQAVPPGGNSPDFAAVQGASVSPDAAMLQTALDAPAPQAPGALPSQEAVTAALPPGIGDTQRAPQQPPSALPSQPAVDTALALPDSMRLPAERTLQDRRTDRPAGSRVEPYRPFQDTEGVEEPRMPRLLGRLGQDALGFVASVLDFVPTIEHTLGLHGRSLQMTLDTDRITDVIREVEQAVRPSLNGQQPDFLDNLAGAIGTSLVSLIPAASVGRFLEGLATVAPRVARVGAALTGGVIEGAGEAGGLRKSLVPLVGEEEAARRALQSFAANVVLVSVTDKYGIFGERGGLLRRVLNGVATNAAQEGLQYDIERRGFTVPTTHPQAAQLKLQGWQEQGGVLFKPFVLQDAAEAAAIGAIIGGTAAATVHLAAEQQIPAVQAFVEQERQIDPSFTFAQGLDAAQSPDTPPPGVEPATWQRWGQAVSSFLTSERGSTGAPGQQPVRLPEITRTPALIQDDLDALAFGGEPAAYVLEQMGVTTADEARAQLTQEQQAVQATTPESEPPHVLHRDLSQSPEAAMRAWLTAQGFSEEDMAPHLAELAEAQQLPQGETTGEATGEAPGVPSAPSSPAPPVLSKGALDAVGAGVIAYGARSERTFLRRMGNRLAGMSRDEKRAVRERSQALYTAEVEKVGKALATTRELLARFRSVEALNLAPWYLGAMEELRSVFGDDAELVAGLIAATSPGQRVATNINLAMTAYAQYKTGQPIVLRANYASSLLPNVHRILRGEPLSGEKVTNFRLNILGDTQAVTNDTWMMRVLGLSTKAIAGKENAPTTTEYRLMTEWVTQLAKDVGVTPRDMQGALWVAIKLEKGPAPGEKAEDITKTLPKQLQEAVQRNLDLLSAISPEMRERLRLRSEQGGTDVGMLLTLAQTLAGGFAGCATADDPEECLSRALTGAGLAALSSPLILKRLWGFSREFSRRGPGTRMVPFLSSERGSTGAPGQEPLPGRITRTPDLIQADIDALDAGGEAQQAVLQRLGVTSLTAASMRLTAEAQQAQDTAQATPETAPPTPESPASPAASPAPVAPAPAGPPLRAGAEGLTPERYRTASGGWVIPLKTIPSRELELQDLVRQQGGIKLEGEELRGELSALVSRAETGLYGLQNNTSGLSLQQMAEVAQQLGFTATADKESLLQMLDRSITQGHPVYSDQATGRINLLDDPHVQGAYQAVLDAVDAMGPATAEQVAGVRHRRDVHAEAQDLIASGQFSLDDVRDLFPNQALNDTMASALLQSMYTVGQQVGAAAQAYLDSGARVGSREEASLMDTMALMAELEPYRLGVSAAQSRGLGILNDPLSGYTQYLNRLHQVLTNAPERTMRQIATKIVAASEQAKAATTPKDQAYWQAHPEELAQLFEEMRAFIAEWTTLPSGRQEQLPLLPEAQASFLSALDILTPEDRARVRADFDALLQSLADATALATEQARARAIEEWERLRAEVDALRAAQAGRAIRSPVGGPPLQLTQETQSTFLDLQRSPEAQALIDAAYTPESGLTREEWRVREAARFREEGSHEFDAQWRADLKAFQAMDAARQRQGGTAPVDYSLVARLDRALHPWKTDPGVPIAKVLAQQARPGFQQYFLELWYNVMLSNPGTHLANTMSNLAVTTWAIPERFLAGQYDPAEPSDTDGRTTPDLQAGVQPGEATAMLYGLTHGIASAWAVAARAFKTGVPASGLSKEGLREPAFTAQNLGMDPSGTFGQVLDFWFNYIGLPWTLPSGGRLPTRALMAADEFFKSLNYSMELNALAYREAARLGYEGTAFAEHVHRVVSLPSLAQMQQAAGSFAVMQTFQQALVPGSLGARVQALANWAPGGVEGEGFPWGRVVLPFVQTPANIARYAAERTPLGFAFRSVREDLAAGGTRGQLAEAKLALGTITLTALAGLAMMGRLVGRGPEDPELRAIWLRQHPEYAVQLPGGRWVSLDRFEPIGMFVGLVGDTAQIAGDQRIPGLERAIAATIYPFMKNVVSKTWFRGMSDFFDALSPRPLARPDQALGQVGRFVLRQGASFAQPSALWNATARLTDPAEKEAWGLVDAIYARLPSMRTDRPTGRATVPNRRTLGGDKYLLGVGLEDDTLANTIRAYVPMRMEFNDVSPADREILANQMRVSKPPRALAAYGVQPGEYADTYSNVDITTYPSLRLSAAEYEAYSVLAGGNQAEAAKLGLRLPDMALENVVEKLTAGMDEQPPGDVKSLDQYLNWLVGTRDYQENQTTGVEGGREGLVQKGILSYREMGRKLLLKHNPALRQRYEESHILRKTLKLPLYERTEKAQDLREQYDLKDESEREELGLPPAVPVPQGLGVSP